MSHILTGAMWSTKSEEKGFVHHSQPKDRNESCSHRMRLDPASELFIPKLTRSKVETGAFPPSTGIQLFSSVSKGAFNEIGSFWNCETYYQCSPTSLLDWNSGRGEPYLFAISTDPSQHWFLEAEASPWRQSYLRRSALFDDILVYNKSYPVCNICSKIPLP